MLSSSISFTPTSITPHALVGGVVHIIDDDRDFSEALAMQLGSVGLATEIYMSAEHFLSTYRPRLVECALLDLRMPGMHGLELQNILRQRHISLPLIVISAYGRTPDIVRAVRNGAINFLDKPVEEKDLLETVCAALAKDNESKLRCSNRSQCFWRLTDRERQVLDLFVGAKTTIEIAHVLGISPKTVEKHRAHIYEKLNVDSVPELIHLVLDVTV